MKMDVTTVSVTFDMMDGTTITISDGETMAGTTAWNDFLHGKGFVYEDNIYPFHAIATAVPTISHETTDVDDDFCKESGECDSLADSAIVDCSKAA